MTTLIRYPNHDVRLTETDRLWTARMLDGEGAGTRNEAILMLWTMIQRKYWGVGPYTVHRPVPRAFGGDSWTTFIRKFAQPINPAWYRDGYKCRRPGGTALNDPGCKEKKLERRADLARTPFNRLDRVAREVTDLFMEGRLPRPPEVVGVLDWRARDGVEVRRPLAEFPFPTGNRYFYNISNASRNHPDLLNIRFVVDGVEVIPSTGGPSEAVIANLMLRMVPGGMNDFDSLIAGLARR